MNFRPFQRCGAPALGLIALLVSPISLASERISMARAVPYASESVGNAAVRGECAWNKLLASEIVRRSRGEIVSTTEDLSNVPGPILDLKIVSVHAIGGGMFTGPKWATVHGELKGGTAPPLRFELRRKSMASEVTACEVLDKIAVTLSKDIVRWLQKHRSGR